MKILILGSDGYLGWSLYQHLGNLKNSLLFQVRGVDNGSRQKLVKEIGGDSLTPYYKKNQILFCDLTDDKQVDELFKSFKPDVIYHFAEQPSAPYSMISVKEAQFTQTNNVIGTLNLLWSMKKHCPDAHLIKLGTMGEYGTPDCKIPELDFHAVKEPGSWYHVSKVQDSYNINLACRIWGLRCTDIMQGVIYGINENEKLTRFDYDECFGTVINRFTVQAIIGYPLTVYGKGGQTRGYIPLKDALNCYLLIADNPPEKGEHRIVNQFAEIYSVNELAEIVKNAGKKIGLNVKIKSVKNPRKEKEVHDYEVEHSWLEQHGYVPTKTIEDEVISTLCTLMPFKDRVIKEVIAPKTNWV